MRASISLATLVLATIPLFTSAGTVDDWAPIKEPADEALAGDASKLAYVFSRCSGNMYAVAKVLEEGADKSELVSAFEGYGDTLMLNHIRVAAKLQGVELQGNAADQIIKDGNEQVMSFAKGYIERMAQNYIRLGSHMSGDPFMEGEISTCRQIAQELSNS